MNRALSMSELRYSERAFVAAMQQLGFGRFEFLRIDNGELMLNPWPTTIRDVKFGSEDPATSRRPSGDFQLKRQIIELFEYVREVHSGEIRELEVRHGLPFSMEVELPGAKTGIPTGGRRA